MNSSASTGSPRPRYKARGKEYVRYGPRDWRYADEEDIQVPGGRDMRLNERFDPIIGSKGGEKQVVIIDGEDVESSPETLGWALAVGTPVRSDNGSLVQVIVPYAAWEAHDQILGIMVAPELDGDEDVRELAAKQLALRKTERILARETHERDKMLVEMAEKGMTRQRAAEITGLSVGKVQQIIKKDELAANEATLVGILDDTGQIGTLQVVEHAKKTHGVTGSKSKIKKLLTSLKSRGFLETTAKGLWSVTPKGRDELERLAADRSIQTAPIQKPDAEVFAGRPSKIQPVSTADAVEEAEK